MYNVITKTTPKKIIQRNTLKSTIDKSKWNYKKIGKVGKRK